MTPDEILFSPIKSDPDALEIITIELPQPSRWIKVNDFDVIDISDILLPVNLSQPESLTPEWYYYR